jgi:hypothetical protein
MHSRVKWLENPLLLVVSGYLLLNCVEEFFVIASGTGNWYQSFSQKWYFAYCLFVFICIGLFVLWAAQLWFPEKIRRFLSPSFNLRGRFPVLRWALGAIVVILPVYLFQFTAVGIVLKGMYLRLLVLSLCTLVLAFLLTDSDSNLITWRSVLISTFVFSALIIFSAQFTDVINFPFSLGWSEGNRLWDFSTLFGRDRYLYPANQPLIPYLDFGRQLIGGLGFLWPGLSISGERFWVDVTNVIPYLLLGGIVFKQVDGKNGWPWTALSLFTFLYLIQVTIHPPLVVSAILLVLVWRRSLWVAVPVIIVAAYFAAISRFTWTFAIGMWAVMLEFASVKPDGEKITRQTWIRSFVAGLAGIFGGYLLPKLLGALQGNYNVGVSASQIEAHLKIQPLLWYRLLPNATYSDGVLLGMLKVAVPLVILLVYFARSGRWKLNKLQRQSLILPLLAFMIVGLVVSTKAGGGGDLHNLDMFFIGLLFTTALAWLGGGREWILDVDAHPFFMRVTIIVLLLIPVLNYMNWLAPNTYSGDVASLMTLAGVKNSGALGLLPPQDQVDKGLERIRSEVAESKEQGDVLFMDQRQLLTFGFVSDVPLVPDYEKKLIMDHAMSKKADYFAQFYRDLANHRFSLIISEPLRVPVKTSEFGFGEENNSWVDWVSRPVLCYYEPIETYPELRTQLLKPRSEAVDCSDKLPPEVHP